MGKTIKKISSLFILPLIKYFRLRYSKMFDVAEHGKRMKLYFTADAKINSEHLILYNQLAASSRKPFTDSIESISSQNAKSIDWWVSSPASRNTFASPLFHYCCCLALLQELIRRKESVSEIVTDSRAFKQILEAYFAKEGINARVTLVPLTVKERFKELIRPIYVMFGLPLYYLLLFFIARHIRPLRKPSLSHSLTLIDTFVMPGYITKDRNYPGLIEGLSERERKHVWFVPHLYGFRPWQFLSVVRKLRRSQRNFVLKDDFLKFQDYWCLWGHLVGVRKLQIKASHFFEVDISSLVREEMTGFRSIGAAYVAFLNYRFAKRLKEVGVNLRLIINWFENQHIDKGWNAGFRQFFPSSETKGYQGFLFSRHFLSLYPTEEERKNEVIPHKILVIGKELVQSVREFCPALDVRVAPALRFQHVWKKRNVFPAAKEYTIIVALPIVIRDAVYMLKLLNAVANEVPDRIRFRIKPHPAISQFQIERAFGADWPAAFTFVSGDFSNCVEKTNLLISSAGSACMETLAKGIPVIIIGSNYGLTQNPIPETLTSDIWRLCFSQQDIVAAIQFYQSLTHEKNMECGEVGKRIREEYFEPVSENGGRQILGL